MVGATAVVALRSANDDAVSLATRLHVEAAANIKVQLDTYLSRATASSDAERKQGLVSLLRSEDLYSDSNGLVFILDRTCATVASSAPDGDPVVSEAR